MVRILSKITTVKGKKKIKNLFVNLRNEIPKPINFKLQAVKKLKQRADTTNSSSLIGIGVMSVDFWSEKSPALGLEPLTLGIQGQRLHHSSTTWKKKWKKMLEYWMVKTKGAVIKNVKKVESWKKKNKSRFIDSRLKMLKKLHEW